MTGRATHGHTRGRKTTPEFNSWLALRQRCNDPKHAKYPTYGARGITVCERWQSSFDAFLKDMGQRPEGTTIDRIDNAKGYWCGRCEECVRLLRTANCRWATRQEQSRNRKPFVHASSAKTHCPSGHLYSAENTRVVAGRHRKCRECERLRASAQRRSRKAAEAA